MDRKQIVELLRQQADEIAREGHAGWGNTMNAAADLLESDGWVSVGERPAESGYYDVWVPGYGRYPNAYWWDEWLSDLAGHEISPTHWRPLPNPPGGDHD